LRSRACCCVSLLVHGIDASLQGENSRDSQEEISKKEKRERPEPDSQPPQLESDFCRSFCVA